jgi:hypothetical protein
LGQFFKNYLSFYPKNFPLALKIWVWDPGSGKNLFRISDPGVKKAPDPGSGSATLLQRGVHKNVLIEALSSIIGLKYCVKYIIIYFMVRGHEGGLVCK